MNAVARYAPTETLPSPETLRAAIAAHVAKAAEYSAGGMLALAREREAMAAECRDLLAHHDANPLDAMIRQLRAAGVEVEILT